MTFDLEFQLPWQVSTDLLLSKCMTRKSNNDNNKKLLHLLFRINSLYILLHHIIANIQHVCIKTTSTYKWGGPHPGQLWKVAVVEGNLCDCCPMDPSLNASIEHGILQVINQSQCTNEPYQGILGNSSTPDTVWKTVNCTCIQSR